MNSRIFTLVLFLLSTSAFAQDISKTENAILQHVSKLTDEIGDVHSDSSGIRSIKRAAARFKKLSSEIKKFEKLTKNTTEHSVAISWQKSLRPLKGAIENLTPTRFKWELIQDLEESCKSTLKDLDKSVDSVMKRDQDTDEIEDLSEDAFDFIDDAIAGAELRLSGIKKRVTQVKRYDAPKGWEKLERAFASSGDKIVRKLSATLKTAKRECDGINKHIRSHYLLDTIEQVEELEDLKSTFLDDGKDWLDRSSSVFNTTCHSKREILKATADIESEPNENPNTKELNRLIKKQQKLVMRDINKLLREYKDFKSVLGKIEDDKNVDKITSLMRVRMKWFKYAMTNTSAPENILFTGARHPKIRAILDYGVDRHDQLQGSKGCTLSEVKLKKSNTRLDCFSAPRCEVIEFKPKNGSNDGKQQAASYAKELSAEYTQLIKMAIADEKNRDLLHDLSPLPDLNTMDDLYGSKKNSYPYIAEVYEEMLSASGCIRNDGTVSISSSVFYYKRGDAGADLRCDDPVNKY